MSDIWERIENRSLKYLSSTGERERSFLQNVGKIINRDWDLKLPSNTLDKILANLEGKYVRGKESNTKQK